MPVPSQQRELRGHRDGITSLVWDAKGERLFSASFDRTIRMWSPESGESLRILHGHTGWVTALAVAGNRLVSVSSDRSIRTWDVETGRSLDAISDAHQGDIFALSLSPDGETIVTGGRDRILKRRYLGSDSVLMEFRGHSDTVLCAAFSPDGLRIASGSDDATVRVWEVETGRQIEKTGHWDVETGLKTEKQGWEPVRSVLWLPDGRRVYALLEGTICEEGPLRRSFWLEDEVGALAANADGSLFASASFDGTVRVWDAANFAVSQVIEATCSQFPVGLAFHPHKPLLAVVNGGNNIKIAELDLRPGPEERPPLDVAASSSTFSFPSVAYFSYRHNDENADRAQTLVADALRRYLDLPVVHLREWPSGEPWESVSARGLTESALFIPIITRDYFASPGCVREYAAMETLEAERISRLDPESANLRFIYAIAIEEPLHPPESLRRATTFGYPFGPVEQALKDLEHALKGLEHETVGLAAILAEQYSAIQHRASLLRRAQPLMFPSEREAVRQLWPDSEGLEKRGTDAQSFGSESQNIDIPEDLVQRIVEGNVVLFVGSAMSSPPLPAGWRALLQEMIAWAKRAGVDTEEAERSVLELIRANELVTASQVLVDLLGGQAIIACLQQLLSGPDVSPNPAYQLLPEIRFAAILTSNFDDFLDQAFPSAPVFTPEDASEFRPVRWRNDFYIAKIRGSLRRPGTLVFSESDFSRMKFGNQEFREELRAVFQSQTILFVGSGLSDPDVQLLLEEAAFNAKSGAQHYALVHTSQWNPARRRSLETQYGIRCLGDDRREAPPDIYQFLLALRDRVLSIRHTNLPPARVFEPYTASIAWRSATWWNVASGALPKGLSVTGGVVTGTPTQAGSYAFEVALTLSGSSHGYTFPSRSYSLEVLPALKIPYSLQFEPFPENMASGQSSPLTLALRRADSGGTQVYIPLDVREIYCFVTAEGFRIEGPEVAFLRVGEDADPSASFMLQAFLRGKRNITLDFYFEDPQSRRVNILSTSVPVEVRSPDADMAGPPVLPALEVRVGPQADVVLHVESELPEGDKGPIRLNYCLSTRLVRPALRRLACGSASLTSIERAGLRRYLFETLADIEGMGPCDVRDRLLSLGDFIRDRLFPRSTTAELHDALDRVADRARTFFISADEAAWMPWEFASVPGHGTKARLLGEQFRIGRWVEGLGPPAGMQIPVGELALAHYLGIPQPDRHSELAAWQSLLKAHGAEGISSCLQPETPIFGIHILRRQIDDERQEIVPRIAADHAVSPEADARAARLHLRSKKPVVGFSILGTSDAGEALTADRAVPFLRGGASAVIGPYTPASECCDQLFWSGFYELLAGGLPVGEAVWRARLSVRSAWPHRADWLSYMLLGNPLARPYEPEAGDGYASFEAVDPRGEMVAGRACKFRVVLRSRPPVGYEERLIRAAEPPAGLSVMFLGPRLAIVPQGPIEMRRSGRSMIEAVVSVTAPAAGSFPLVAQLLEGDEHVKTLQLNLRIHS